MPDNVLPSHIAWLLEHRGKMLSSKLKSENIEINPEQALRVLMDADPSTGKLATQWLCDTYLAGGFRWEDVAAGQDSKAAETLIWFAEHRKKLDRTTRNLSSYLNLAAVYTALKAYLPPKADAVETGIEPSGRTLRRQERELALNESIILYRSSELIAAVPLSEQAAKWWGRGTRWCTAADKHNAFYTYHIEAPLIVLVLKDVEGTTRKLQLHVTSHELQFMDENDDEISSDLIDKNWNILGGIVEWAFKQNPLALEYIPISKQTYEMYEVAAKFNRKAFGFIPEEYRTKDLWMSISDVDAISINDVPLSVLDSLLIEKIIQKNGGQLVSVPKHDVTAKLCELAVKQDGQALYYVPKKFFTHDLYLIAVSQNGLALRNVPEAKRDLNLCLAAVIQNLQALRYVPIPYITYDLYRIIFEHGNSRLDLVPEEYLTFEICLMAVSNNGNALIFVPDDICNAEIYETAIRQDGKALYYVPEEKRIDDLCRLAVEQDPFALQFVPYEIGTPELYRMAVSKDPMMLQHVPYSKRTFDLCLNAIGEHQCTVAMEWVPYEILGEDFYLRALEKNAYVLSLIPENELTAEMVDIAQKSRLIDSKIKSFNWEKDEFLESIKGVFTQQSRLDTEHEESLLLNPGL